MADRMEDFRNQLKEKGYKLTMQRQAVLNSIIEHEGEHLSTEEIYELVKKNHPEIGLATVYRTLLLLDRMELVYKLDLDDGCSRYELNKDNEDHRHHHLICTECGSVEEVQEDLLESLEEQILQKNGFIIKDHRVKFYGCCKKCIELLRKP
ncbi:Fur family ferric uptake transcriptional regulator [Anaerobacterium chartisolvens]|uniref:Fur family ferric uptake transcriptional regulator n=1 Tax=Anaerobacterium chartisolvens TaxID=1297424 RepID=A0A369B1W9_9FIRM|nr:Fur family transcriptional regulator [Anaerobacterium chartisolvens]RCX15433.1 Fur family ferric uptake transcriptional regulator [Anaerobacterium chartisolvens]